MVREMGFPKNRGTPKWMVYNRKHLLKWMIWGYHYFRKHPNSHFMTYWLTQKTSLFFLHLDALLCGRSRNFQVAVPVENLLSRVSRCVFLGPIGEYDFVKIAKATVWQIRRFETESPNITGSE